MTAPGGDPGHSGYGEQAGPPPAAAQPPEQPQSPEQPPPPEQPVWRAPWNPPASSSAPPAAGYPPALDYPYPEAFPPTGYPSPEYQQPPGPSQFGGYFPQYPQYPQYPQHPQHDYSGGWGAPHAAQTGMNSMAVASLICSLTGLLCCIGSIVAIVLGTVAIDQIKRSREEGYALAVSGIVIGVAGLLVYLIVAMFAMHSQ